jgi:hypothetical protein
MLTANDGYTPSRDFRRVATIPLHLLFQWKQEEGWDPFAAGYDPDCARKLAQKLNDPEWSHLRTAPGRVGVSNGVLR